MFARGCRFGRREGGRLSESTRKRKRLKAREKRKSREEEIERKGG
jgi:hypothetical protein